MKSYFLIFFNKVFAFFIAFLLLTWIIILPFSLEIEILTGPILLFLKDWAPGLAYLILIVIVQNLVCRFIILQDSTKNTAIDNRRFYHLFAYFFYLNVSSTLVNFKHFLPTELWKFRIFFNRGQLLISITTGKWSSHSFI